ncbi:Endoplasmic reticulum lectin 1 [Cichlidogyrus casuarinus]|uniref:Endoplasmic reticulum lectin 1 n=1 Tax=Cichlidogyrus casuarinus TaxID=1844966 RepID=A0ABD2QBI9_9PLAT
MGFFSPMNNFMDHRSQGFKTITLEGREFPYFQLNFTGGDVCDLTGTKRSANILYVCNEMSTADIYQITEPESCSYQVVVLTKHLCSHPKYRPRANYVNEVVCYTENADPKPKSLIEFEKAREELHSGKFSISLDALFGSPEVANFKIEAKRDKSGIVYRIKMNEEESQKDDLVDELKAEMRDEVTEEELEKVLKDARSTLSKLMTATNSMNERMVKDATEAAENVVEKVQMQADPSKPSYTALTVVKRDDLRGFLQGASKKCFISGYGWWQQMLCFQSSVQQFHDNDDGTRIEIILGRWNKQAHLKAYRENLNFRKNSDLQLFYYFLNGDICKETGKPRQTIVKLACDPRNELMQQAFLEDPTCHYYFELKSAALCPVIAAADKETGDIPPEALQ